MSDSDVQTLATRAGVLAENATKTHKEMRLQFQDLQNTISGQASTIASLQSEIAQLRELCAENLVKNPQVVREFLDNNTKLLADAIFEVACGRIPGSELIEENATLREQLQKVQHEADFAFSTFDTASR